MRLRHPLLAIGLCLAWSAFNLSAANNQPFNHDPFNLGELGFNIGTGGGGSRKHQKRPEPAKPAMATDVPIWNHLEPTADSSKGLFVFGAGQKMGSEAVGTATQTGEIGHSPHVVATDEQMKSMVTTDEHAIVPHSARTQQFLLTDHPSKTAADTNQHKVDINNVTGGQNVSFLPQAHDKPSSDHHKPTEANQTQPTPHGNPQTVTHTKPPLYPGTKSNQIAEATNSQGQSPMAKESQPKSHLPNLQGQISLPESAFQSALQQLQPVLPNGSTDKGQSDQQQSNEAISRTKSLPRDFKFHPVALLEWPTKPVELPPSQMEAFPQTMGQNQPHRQQHYDPLTTQNGHSSSAKYANNEELAVTLFDGKGENPSDMDVVMHENGHDIRNHEKPASPTETQAKGLANRSPTPFPREAVASPFMMEGEQHQQQAQGQQNHTIANNKNSLGMEESFHMPTDHHEGEQQSTFGHSTAQHQVPAGSSGSLPAIEWPMIPGTGHGKGAENPAESQIGKEAHNFHPNEAREANKISPTPLQIEAPASPLMMEGEQHQQHQAYEGLEAKNGQQQSHPIANNEGSRDMGVGVHVPAEIAHHHEGKKQPPPPPPPPPPPSFGHSTAHQHQQKQLPAGTSGPLPAIKRRPLIPTGIAGIFVDTPLPQCVAKVSPSNAEKVPSIVCTLMNPADAKKLINSHHPLADATAKCTLFTVPNGALRVEIGNDGKEQIQLNVAGALGSEKAHELKEKTGRPLFATVNFWRMTGKYAVKLKEQLKERGQGAPDFPRRAYKHPIFANPKLKYDRLDLIQSIRKKSNPAIFDGFVLDFSGPFTDFSEPFADLLSDFLLEMHSEKRERLLAKNPTASAANLPPAKPVERRRFAIRLDDSALASLKQKKHEQFVNNLKNADFVIVKQPKSVGANIKPKMFGLAHWLVSAGKVDCNKIVSGLAQEPAKKKRKHKKIASSGQSAEEAGEKKKLKRQKRAVLSTYRGPPNAAGAGTDVNIINSNQQQQENYLQKISSSLTSWWHGNSPPQLATEQQSDDVHDDEKPPLLMANKKEEEWDSSGDNKLLTTAGSESSNGPSGQMQTTGELVVPSQSTHTTNDHRQQQQQGGQQQFANEPGSKHFHVHFHVADHNLPFLNKGVNPLGGWQQMVPPKPKEWEDESVATEKHEIAVHNSNTNGEEVKKKEYPPPMVQKRKWLEEDGQDDVVKKVESSPGTNDGEVAKQPKQMVHDGTSGTAGTDVKVESEKMYTVALELDFISAHLGGVEIAVTKAGGNTKAVIELADQKLVKHSN